MQMIPNFVPQDEYLLNSHEEKIIKLISEHIKVSSVEVSYFHEPEKRKNARNLEYLKDVENVLDKYFRDYRQCVDGWYLPEKGFVVHLFDNEKNKMLAMDILIHRRHRQIIKLINYLTSYACDERRMLNTSIQECVEDNDTLDYVIVTEQGVPRMIKLDDFLGYWIRNLKTVFKVPMFFKITL